MSRLSVVVADDEPLARAGLETLVRRDPELDLVASCADGAETMAAIRAHGPDLALLDIAMPLTSGVEVVRALTAEPAVTRMPLIVFVTAFDQYAVTAFDLYAVDYVLKPFDDVRFASAIGRAKRRAREAAAGALNDQLMTVVQQLTERAAARDDHATPASATSGPVTRLLLRHDGRSLLLRVDDIDWIEAADYCVRIHAGSKVHVLRESLGSLSSRLDPARFFRSHRSAIVNLDRVREIQPTFRGECVIVCRDGSRVTLARSRRSALESLLGGRI